MSNVKFSLFIKKAKKNTQNQHPIVLTISVAGVRSQIYTGVSVELKQWNPILKKVKGYDENAKALNSTLEALLINARQISNQLMISGVPFNPNTIKEQLRNGGKKSPLLIESFDKFLSRMNSLIPSRYTRATLVKYTNTKNRVKEFVKHKTNRNDIFLYELNTQFMEEFDIWLRTKYQNNNNSVYYAQLTPQPSSTQSMVQDFGLGKINLVYSRPDVKGRKIFGGLEPYGTVWRTGANSATVIKFSDEVTMEGNKVPAGEYGLFSIPGEKEWTIILSKQSKQWGAYTYKPADDFLRFKVKTEHLAQLTETMTLAFTNVTPASCDLQMMWEHSGFVIHMTTDIDTKVMARIDSAMNTDKKTYYEALIYYYNNNKDMDKALAWATELEKDKNFPPFVPKLWKARVLLKKGDKAAAIATAEQGAKFAADMKTDEYVRLNNEVIAQAKK